MPDTLSQPLHDWQNFYLLIGGAAATLVGLIFVAISLGSGLLTKSSIPALRTFVSPTVIHFTYVLVTALVVMIPTVTTTRLGILLVIVGIISFGFALGTVSTMRRWRRPGDVYGGAWLLLMPLISYLLYVGTGIALLRDVGQALDGLALASILLLVTGIRNAWDTLLFIVMTQSESPKRESSVESLPQSDGRAIPERPVDSVVQPSKETGEKPSSLALPPSHQADVTRVIQEAGLNPSDFTWAIQPSRRALIGPLISALVHTPTGYFFRFEFIEDAAGQKRVSVFSAGEDAHEVTKAAGSWEDQLGHIRTWLTYLQPHRG